MRRLAALGVGLMLWVGGLAVVPASGGQASGGGVRAVDVDLVGGGVWVTWSDGRVEGRSFAGEEVAPVPELGQPLSLAAGESAVALMPSGSGYWLVTSRGRVARAGDAAHHGDLSGFALNSPVVAAAPTASGGGYYLLGADGGVFTFGDAVFYGSVQGIVDDTIGPGALASDHLSAPVVTLATTPAGYWLVAGDGAVFPFGDAPYHGSVQDQLNPGYDPNSLRRDWTITPPVTPGAQRARDALVAPIVDVVPSAAGAGYLMLASDGGVFNFGQSQFHGSLAGKSASPAVSSDVTASRDGYTIVTAIGHTHYFGSLADAASGPQVPVDRSTLEGILAEARARRQITIDELTAKINSGEYGIGADNILRGPAGFEINLNDCPDNWDNTEGITDTQIEIGATGPFISNTVRSTTEGYIGGWKNYLAWVNDHDPILVDDKPRETTILYAGQYRLSSALSAGAFAVRAHTAGITTDSVGRIHEECVPHIFAVAGRDVGHDPETYPWVTGIDRRSESHPIVWGKYIEKHIATQYGPVRIAAAVADNAWGKAQESQFRKWANANPHIVSEFEVVRFNPASLVDPASFGLTRTMQALADQEPDVLFAVVTNNKCRTAATEADASGLLDAVEVAFLSSNCTSRTGLSSDRWRSLGTAHKDLASSLDRPFVQLMVENLLRAGLDPNTSTIRQGYFVGYVFVEALRIAAALPGGLSRTNLVLASRSIDLYHPLLLDGVSFNLHGGDDTYPIEGGLMLRWSLATEEWVDDEVLDASGETPNCRWVAQLGICR